MSEFDSQDAARALASIAELTIENNERFEDVSSLPQGSQSDNEEDSPCPYFDEFYNQGPTNIVKMTNFTASEFEQLWILFQTFIFQNYNLRWGQKCSVRAKDMLFMLLVVIKFGGQWDALGRLFKINGPTFERMMTRLCSLISTKIYDTLVIDHTKSFNMTWFQDKKAEFSNFSEALYAVDVTFQQSFRPSGSIEEGKLYFSGKQKLYGYKCEASVLPNGLCVGVSNHCPGSISDFEIFQRRKEWHLSKTKKSEDKILMIDAGQHADQHPHHWAILADKGYQGILEIARGIVPKKKPPRGALTLSEEGFNRSVASDRIIVENFFGRLCTLWIVVSNKWRWAEGIYDDFF